MAANPRSFPTQYYGQIVKPSQKGSPAAFTNVGGQIDTVGYDFNAPVKALWRDLPESQVMFGASLQILSQIPLIQYQNIITNGFEDKFIGRYNAAYGFVISRANRGGPAPAPLFLQNKIIYTSGFEDRFVERYNFAVYNTQRLEHVFRGQIPGAARSPINQYHRLYTSGIDESNKRIFDLMNQSTISSITKKGGNVGAPAGSQPGNVRRNKRHRR